MRKLIWVLFWVGSISGCAIGSQIDAAIDEIEGTLAELEADLCIEDCDAAAEVCWDDANGDCVDTCELENKECDAAEDVCLDLTEPACWDLDGAAYHHCMDDAHEQCDLACDDTMGDCMQACGDEAAMCILGDGVNGEPEGLAMCTAGCVRELQDSLKGIDLKN